MSGTVEGAGVALDYVERGDGPPVAARPRIAPTRGD